MAGLAGALGPPSTTTLTTFAAGVTGPPPEEPLIPSYRRRTKSRRERSTAAQPMRNSLAAATSLQILQGNAAGNGLRKVRAPREGAHVAAHLHHEIALLNVQMTVIAWPAFAAAA